MMGDDAFTDLGDNLNGAEEGFGIVIFATGDLAPDLSALAVSEQVAVLDDATASDVDRNWRRAAPRKRSIADHIRV